MTLIASVTLEGLPLVLGDLLLTGPPDETDRFEVPTRSDITSVFPVGSRKAPVGLSQKIALVTSTCAVAWSGRSREAGQIIKELIDFGKQGLLTPNFLNAYFVELERKGTHQKESFVFLLKDDDGLALGGHRCVYDEPDTTMAVGGSGWKEFIRLFLRPGTVASSTLPEYGTLLIKSLNIGGQLLAKEIFSDRPLLNWFGGGYEVALLNAGGEFKKFEDVTFLVYEKRKADDDSDYQVDLRYLTKNTYFDDVLIVNSALFEIGSSSDVEVTFTPVPPVYRRLTLNDLAPLATKPISTKSSIYCFIFSLGNGRSFTFCTVNPDPHEFNIEESGNRVRIESSSEWISEIVQEGLQMVALDLGRKPRSIGAHNDYESSEHN